MSCQDLSTCRVVTPDDFHIGYSGYVDLLLDGSRAAFQRTYAGNLVGLRDGPLQTPGARVHWRTDAEIVDVVLQYQGSVHPHHCSESCAITNSGTCYSSACHARCAVLLFIDGELREDATRHSDGEYDGEVRVAAMRQADAGVHEYELVMPWSAVVEFKWLEISSTRAEPQLLSNQPLPSFIYVAYGDSIVHGWCGRQPYPELIARRNGWQSVNLGVAGMGATPEAEWAHGAAIAQAGGALVSIAIGTNDFWVRAAKSPVMPTCAHLSDPSPRPSAPCEPKRAHLPDPPPRPGPFCA